jgi:uncharacterized protein (DUF983 family)
MPDTAPAPTAASPFLAGLRGRCPRCGEGALFAGYLKPADACPRCGLDYSFIDSGDGPAVFVIFAAGFLIVPPAVVVDLLFHPPMWANILVWTLVLLAVSLGLLRLFKGGMIALQFQHKAEEARLDHHDPGNHRDGGPAP